MSNLNNEHIKMYSYTFWDSGGRRHNELDEILNKM